VKVRIGLGLGVRSALAGPEFGEYVDAAERLGFDSVWFSERINGPAPDPIVAMAYAAGRTTRLKFGTSVLVLPGRNPVVLAKELATLAVMSGGRLLPAFGLGTPEPREHQAFGVAREERAAWFDEALSVMRSCWFDEVVDHDGVRFHYEGLKVRPQPTRLDVWLGGIAPSELRRVGRLGDGWLPSFVTPGEAAAGRGVIEQVAHEHGRAIPDDHWGVLIPYAFEPPDPEVLARLAKRRTEFTIPIGWQAVTELIERFVGEGFTKFVMSPLKEPPSWVEHLEAAAEVLLPLERD
jgi:probable F420-dependent oxidoreductase